MMAIELNNREIGISDCYGLREEVAPGDGYVLTWSNETAS